MSGKKNRQGEERRRRKTGVKGQALAGGQGGKQRWRSKGKRRGAIKGRQLRSGGGGKASRDGGQGANAGGPSSGLAAAVAKGGKRGRAVKGG